MLRGHQLWATTSGAAPSTLLPTSCSNTSPTSATCRTTFPALTNAEPADGDAVYVTAEENGTSHDAEAWFRVDRDRRHLDWGSEGDNDCHGRLGVTADGDGSQVTVQSAQRRR